MSSVLDIFLAVERASAREKVALKCEKTHVAAQIKVRDQITHPKLFVVFSTSLTLIISCTLLWVLSRAEVHSSLYVSRFTLP